MHDWNNYPFYVCLDMDPDPLWKRLKPLYLEQRERLGTEEDAWFVFPDGESGPTKVYFRTEEDVKKFSHDLQKHGIRLFPDWRGGPTAQLLNQ